jgi:shikimate dehydrogenase
MDCYGLVGYPLKHSVSPQIHNAAFRYLSIDAEYVKLELRPDKVERALINLREDFKGINITIPYKEIAAKYFRLEGYAKKIGAVNTVDFTSMKAYNTDVYGALKAIETRIKLDDLKNMVVLVAGAGGAAKAVSFPLVERGATVLIYNRTESRGLKLVEELRKYGKAIFVDHQRLKEIRHADLVINTTPLGMSGFENILPVPESIIKDNIVFDTVYNPLETILIKKAKEKGCEVISGVEMLVYQAAKAFEIWIKRDAPINVMRRAAIEALSNQI